MYILPNATDFNNACASESRTVATKCEIYDDITEISVGEIATFDTGVSKPLSSLKLALTPKQDLNGYDKPWVGGVGKNLLENTATSTTLNGVTFTVNADGSVTASTGSGTATADAQLSIVIDTTKVYGDLYFVGLSGTAESTANVYMWDVTVGARCKQWDGTTASLNSFDGTLKQVKIIQGNSTKMNLRVLNGKSFNATFYPMICKSTETSPTWSPYSNICPIYPSNGKNLLNNTASSSSPSGITFTVNADGTVTATGTATADAQLLIPFSGLSGDYYFCGCPSDGNASTKYDVYAWDSTANARFKKWNGTTNSASDVGTYSLQEIQIPSGHSGYIVIRIKNGYAIQGGLLFKPMIVASTETSNIYVPYQGIGVEHTGKNVLDLSYATAMGTGTSITVGSGSIRVQNSNSYRYTAFGFWRNGLQDIGALPLKKYTFSFDVSGTLTTTWQAGLRYSSNSNFLTGARVEFSTEGHYSVTFDLSQITEPVYLSASRTGNSTANIDVTFSNIQLELGQTATAYEPYTSTTYPIPLGRNVYSGTLDVVSGKLTVDKAIVDLGSLTWGRYTDIQDKYIYLASVSGMDTTSAKIMSSMFKCRDTWVSLNSLAFGEMQSHPSLTYIYARDDNCTTKEAFTSAVNGQQLVYELATPIVYDLTPQQIQTLLGTNNIWSDGNAIDEITYFGVTVVMDGDGINGEIISMEWDNIVCSNDGLQIGTTCMDEFKMTYRPVSTTMSMMGKEIHPYVGLEFGSPATVTYVPLGVFYVTNSETNDDGYTVNITAYDGMQKLLGDFDATALGVTFPINAWALLTAIATHFGLTISYDKLTYELLTSDNYTLTTSNGETLLVQQEINANQQAPLNKPLEGTYRDYVGWIVGLVGANAHMGRSGDLWVGRYEDHGFVIGRNVQHMGGAKINYGGSVTYECIISGTDEEPLQPTGHSGNSITYTNPYITQEELDILNDALFADGNVVVTPCDVAWRSNPCVDAGDIVSVVDKDGNNSLTFVMERVMRVTGGLAEDLHCYAETEVVHTLNKSPLVTKFAQLTNDIKEAVNPIDATKGTFEFIDNGDGTNGGFTIYENGTNSWLRCTAGGLGISADGGLTYTNAITKKGIVASDITVRNGSSTLLAHLGMTNYGEGVELCINDPNTGKYTLRHANYPLASYTTSTLTLYSKPACDNALEMSSYTASGSNTTSFNRIWLQQPGASQAGGIALTSSYYGSEDIYVSSISFLGHGTATSAGGISLRSDGVISIGGSNGLSIGIGGVYHTVSWQTKTINGTTINYLGY